MAAIRDPATGSFVKQGFVPPKRGKPGVTDKDLGYDKIMKALGQLDGDTILDVGTFDDDNPMKAASAEFGYGHSPARPFMSSAFDSMQAELERDIARQLGKTLDLGRGSRRAALMPSAEELRAAIVQTLDAWTDPSNADSTIEQKGFDDPLVDQGDLRGSIVVQDSQGGTP